MKKTVSIKLMVTLVMLLLPLLMGATEHITYTATYGGSPILGTRTLGGVTYSTVKYDGLFNTGEPGSPSLPVESIQFSVPWNATNFSVTATPIMGDPIVLDYPVYPIQSNATQVTLPNNASYSGTYPSTMAWYVDEGLSAGENHVVTVAVMPMRCDHSNGTVLQVIKSVNLTLNYELSETPSIYPIARRGASLREEGYEWVKSMVVNPTDVRGHSYSSASITANRQDDIITDPYTYIIITTPELKHSVRRIAALNQQKGVNVKVVTVEEALNDTITEDGDYFSWGGNNTLVYSDDAGKLRSFLKGCYAERGCEYVLLAGSNVPYRNCDGGQADMYFSELYANWMNSFLEDQRRRGILYVGRLLGNEPELIDNYTDKLFRYELNPGNGDYSYLTHALFTESNQYGWLNDIFREIVADICPDTVRIREIPNQNFPTCQNVLDSINSNHYGFISFVNYAVPSHILLYSGDQIYDSHYLWALSDVKTYPNAVDGESDNGLNHMDNKYYPMIGFSQIGNTMSYDCKQQFNLDVSFGESFTMGKDYGGPVFIGMTYPYWQNSYNCDYYFDEFSNNFGLALSRYNGSLAKAFLSAKASYAYNTWEVMNSCYNYLGDPAVSMWTDIPQVYSNITVQRTDNSIVLAGLPANQPSIAYHSNDGVTGKIKATSSTMTLNNVSPNSTVMIYGVNRIPFIAPLVLQNTTLEHSQYVIADEVTAGKSVDTNRTNGEVTVADGAEYEIEASGKVTLVGGFKVEKGALFSVLKSSYK